jgi:hypothetical protein
VIKAGGVEVVLTGLRKHGHRADVTERACALIQNIAVFGTSMDALVCVSSLAANLFPYSSRTNEAVEAGRKHVPHRRHTQPSHQHRYAEPRWTSSQLTYQADLPFVVCVVCVNVQPSCSEHWAHCGTSPSTVRPDLPPAAFCLTRC